MKRTRFGIALLAAGLAVGLVLFAYLLDHVRASAHVVRGLGDAAEREREEEPLAVPEAKGNAIVSADEVAEQIGRAHV